MGLAAHNYADGHMRSSDNYFPPAVNTGPATDLTWVASILSYIEEGNLANSTAMAGTESLDWGTCPSFAGTQTNAAFCYAGNAGHAASDDNGGMEETSADVYGLGTAEFRATGLSKVIMIGEAAGNTSSGTTNAAAANWNTVGDVRVYGDGSAGVGGSGTNYASDHVGGLIGVCFADGSTAFLITTDILSDVVSNTAQNIRRK